MRRFTLILMSLFILNSSFASSFIVRPPVNASEIFLPVGKTGMTISLKELAHIKVKDFELLTDQKLKFFDRLAFKAAQKKLRNNINDDGTFNNKRILKTLSKQKDGETGFHIGGFALGFLLGLIGVLIAYLINDDYKSNRVKWAWLGLAISVGIVLIIIAAGGVPVY